MKGMLTLHKRLARFHKRVSKEESLESTQIFHKFRRFQNLFFFLFKMWRFQNFFFPSWKCGDLVFFLEIFQNARFTMYVFMGDFSTDFRHKKIKIKIKINK
jgi:hypothetical protein